MIWDRSLNPLGQHLSVKHGRFKGQVWRNLDEAAAVLRRHRHLDFLLPYHLPPPLPRLNTLTSLPSPPAPELCLNE